MRNEILIRILRILPSRETIVRLLLWAFVKFPCVTRKKFYYFLISKLKYLSSSTASGTIHTIRGIVSTRLCASTGAALINVVVIRIHNFFFFPLCRPSMRRQCSHVLLSIRTLSFEQCELPYLYFFLFFFLLTFDRRLNNYVYIWQECFFPRYLRYVQNRARSRRLTIVQRFHGKKCRPRFLRGSLKKKKKKKLSKW